MRLMSSRSSWIWAHPEWPHLRYDPAALAPALARAHSLHGQMLGRAQAIGLNETHPVALAALSDEMMATAAIEGERLALEVVRSSVMRRLGLPGPSPSDRHVEGLLDVISDAWSGFDQALDTDRLCRWQAALFPGGISGLRRIAVGRYREHPDPMQIVSGPPGREQVHYEAPPSGDVPEQMQHFLRWFNQTVPEPRPEPREWPLGDGLARAAMAHLWFESIHPFEDGNGRIGRALIDLAMAQHGPREVRLHSLSRQLLKSRAAYYDALNRAQRGSCDVTDWVHWFVTQCADAYLSAVRIIDQAIEKRRFWEQHPSHTLPDRQRKVLQRLLDDGDGGFLGGLNADKYMKMTGVSKATATRDLSQMVLAGQLRSHGQGKAIRYYIRVPGWTHGLASDPAPTAPTAPPEPLSPEAP